VGAAVFLRYSLARFLRFWLLRQLYEGQAQVDQLVAHLGNGRDVDSIRRSYVAESDTYERRNTAEEADTPAKGSGG
jgi:hypothetical protein